MSKKSPGRTATKKAAATKRPLSARRSLKASKSSKRQVGRASRSLDAARVAERERPGWAAVSTQAETADRATGAIHVDASVPELTRLKQKYFGSDMHGNGISAPTDDAAIVPMKPKAPGADDRAGRKATVVQKNRVIGVQG